MRKFYRVLACAILAGLIAYLLALVGHELPVLVYAVACAIANMGE